ncbi:hypothetical protein Q5P01_024223 [Channa striata]|uniref:Uncharacterized protein n=1 Tax=Channa striata TaxID=64152 RepID=A0AA88IRW8_CHASR|nr:hypothetical protein Q5P01_024223 [Channa striata]
MLLTARRGGHGPTIDFPPLHPSSLLLLPPSHSRPLRLSASLAFLGLQHRNRCIDQDKESRRDAWKLCRCVRRERGSRHLETRSARRDASDPLRNAGGLFYWVLTELRSWLIPSRGIITQPSAADWLFQN